MNLIVAVDEKWGIGKKNGLLFSLKGDMKFFREKTLNKVVCMGYNTLLSFPGGKALKNRINIVLAPEGTKREDCIVVHTLNDMFNEIKKYDSDSVFVIGGGMFYKTMYPYCSKAYVTKILKDGNAEVFFDNLDKIDGWSHEIISETMEENGIEYYFTLYKNEKPAEYRQ